MKCPFCAGETKVTDKRGASEANRRRRECLSCGKRFTTYERFENSPLMVVKKDSSREQFDRNKILSGVLKACEKRPISREQVETLVEKIESEIFNRFSDEVSSRDIGEIVAEKLKDFDKVAYVRFASVYREFEDVKSFEKEVERLLERKAVRGTILKVRKRDGRIVDFDKSKIESAIFKAAQAVGGSDASLAEQLAEQVVILLEEKFSYKIPSVEDVQDTVEKILVENGHYKTAKAFILYRRQHAKIRETKSIFVDALNTTNEYLEQSDWRVKENSNEDYSFSGLMLHISGKIIANYALNNIYTPAIAEAHKKGYFHIHDLGHGIVGYCSGWSLKNLLVRGFGNVPNKVDAKPPKHLNSAVHQMVNFLGCCQMEFAGAQAFSSVDTLLAPFVKVDNLTFKQVKQSVQELVYSLNIPSRWGCFSEDTEVLTDKGWKMGSDLKVGEVIATLNINTNRIQYKPVLAMTKYNYKGKMIRLKNRIQDQLVTPDHKVLRKIHNFDEGKSESMFVLEDAKNIKTKNPLIPLGAYFDGESAHENFVKLLAWIVSEGSVPEKERIVLYQSIKNSKNCNEIREVMHDLDINFDERMTASGFTNERNVIRFRINRPYSKLIKEKFFIQGKRMPDIMKNLDSSLCKTFIEELIKGDGHKPTNRIIAKEKKMVDDLQEIIAKAGWGSTHYKTKKDLYIVRVIKHQTTSVSVEEQDYDGVVWCPTTVNKTVVARRNGKVFLSGNCQMPFTNLTFDWTVPEDMKNESAIVGGKQQSFCYGDCQKEMDMINRAFLEVMKEGDARGRIFTFPIPTYNITKDFDWNLENAALLFEVTAKYGIPYFQNYIGTNLNPKDIRAMCCRLNLDMRELLNRGNGLFGAGEQTGSIGVVTLNLNRLAYEAKGSKEQFFKLLRYYMVLAKESLETKREVIEKNMKNGLMPYAKTYLGSFRTYFSTIGLCGMNEACLNLLGKNIASAEGKTMAIDVLLFMRDMLKQFQQETGNLYNLEATPAESASYRLAKLDKEIYPDIITAGTSAPYLTNSTHLPVDFTDNAIEALEHQNDIQYLYTGGTVFHTFLGEKLSSGESCKALVKKIAFNTRIPYFSITPTFSICPEHGYLAGEQHVCNARVQVAEPVALPTK